jgi:sodium-dependent dicarboxylate transporter 2/3/5
MLTGHASLASAAAAGKHKAFAYLEKPIETDILIETITGAAQERRYDIARQEMPVVESRTILGWLWGTYNFRPGIMMLGAVIFAAVYLMPTSEGLNEILSAPSSGNRNTDMIGGYARYGQMRDGETIPQYYSRSAKRSVVVTSPSGEETHRPLNAGETAQAAKVMIAVLIICALFWATGAMPVGITALLVGLLMYLFHVFPADMVAQSYAKDSVVFIFGVLALAVVVAKTGLDRRIGLVLLGTSRSLKTYLFIFCPLLAMSAAFLSEHALVAFIVPILMVVYMGTIKIAKVKGDHALAVCLLLALNFTANQGGPGSPAAGGRNAVMVGILADYGSAPSFGEWMMYGMPFVPVMALVIATYFYFAVGRKVKIQNVDIAAMVKRESKKLGKMTRQEWITLVVFALVVVLWIMSGETEEGLGMGGPALLGLVLLAVFGILTWKDVTKISWEVVALYAAATAMGAGLATTGGALWMAREFVAILPEYFTHGDDLRDQPLGGRAGDGLRLFLRQHTDRRDAEQRHRLLAGQGLRDGRAAHHLVRFLQAWVGGHHPLLAGALGMDDLRLLAVDRHLM